MSFANPPRVKSELVMSIRNLDGVGSCPAKNVSFLIGLAKIKGLLKGERESVFNEWFLTTTIIINPSSDPPLTSHKKAGKVAVKGRRKCR